jgi:hypothetical protein
LPCAFSPTPQLLFGMAPIWIPLPPPITQRARGHPHPTSAAHPMTAHARGRTDSRSQEHGPLWWQHTRRAPSYGGRRVDLATHRRMCSTGLVDRLNGLHGLARCFFFIFLIY